MSPKKNLKKYLNLMLAMEKAIPLEMFSPNNINKITNQLTGLRRKKIANIFDIHLVL